MEQLFLNILDLGLNSSSLILIVMVLRLFLKKAPKGVSVWLWGFVGLRLICPISIERSFSLFPTTAVPSMLSGPQTAPVTPAESWNPISALVYGDSPYQSTVHAVAVIWIIGMAVMLLYTSHSWFRLHRKVQESVPFQDQFRLCDHIQTPFILGFFHPRIYLPSNLAPEDFSCVLAHERSHLCRKDHWWKPIAFLILNVYWFHPLVWISYLLLCRDIEFACDERVLSTVGPERKKAYASALVHCSMPRKAISACPLAFGECNVKARIQAILHYRRPPRWIVVTAMLLCLTVGAGCLTVPVRAVELPNGMDGFLKSQVEQFYKTSQAPWNAICSDLHIMDVRQSNEEYTVYAWVLYEEFHTDGTFEPDTAAYMPTVITVSFDHDSFELTDYRAPRAGIHYLPDILRTFPVSLWSDAMNPMKHYDELNLLLGQELKTSLPEKQAEMDAYYDALIEQEQQLWEEEQKQNQQDSQKP